MTQTIISLLEPIPGNCPLQHPSALEQHQAVRHEGGKIVVFVRGQGRMGDDGRCGDHRVHPLFPVATGGVEETRRIAGFLFAKGDDACEKCACRRLLPFRDGAADQLEPSGHRSNELFAFLIPCG
jgi:hypothetical protein